MPFKMPQNVPFVGNPRQTLEDQLWASRKTGVSEGGDFFDTVHGRLFENKRTLPMYKDKPYSYAPSQRVRPMYRRKGVLALLTLLFLIFLYYTGGFRSSDQSVDSRNRWTWLKFFKSKKVVNWSERREKVVDAFILSWDAYKTYAWGGSLPVLMWVRLQTDVSRFPRPGSIPSYFKARRANGPQRPRVDYH